MSDQSRQLKRAASRSAHPLESEPLFESSPGGASEGSVDVSGPFPYHSAFQRGNEPETAYDSAQRASEDTKNEEMAEVQEFEVSGRADGYFVAWIALVSMIRRRPPVTLFDGCVDYWTLEEHKETVGVNGETKWESAPKQIAIQMLLEEGDGRTNMEAREEKKEREKKMMEELQEKKKEFWLGSISRIVVLWVSIVLEWCMIVILFGQNKSNIKAMTDSWLHGELCKTGNVDSWWLCAGIVVLLLQMAGEVEEIFQLRQIISHCGAIESQDYLQFLATMVLILMPKVLTPLVLFVVGSFFLATSESNRDIVLNCTALSFVLSIDDLAMRAFQRKGRLFRRAELEWLNKVRRAKRANTSVIQWEYKMGKNARKANAEAKKTEGEEGLALRATPEWLILICLLVVVIVFFCAFLVSTCTVRDTPFLI